MSASPSTSPASTPKPVASSTVPSRRCPSTSTSPSARRRRSRRRRPFAPRARRRTTPAPTAARSSCTTSSPGARCTAGLPGLTTAHLHRPSRRVLGLVPSARGKIVETRTIPAAVRPRSRRLSRAVLPTLQLVSPRATIPAMVRVRASLSIPSLSPGLSSSRLTARRPFCAGWISILSTSRSPPRLRCTRSRSMIALHTTPLVMPSRVLGRLPGALRRHLAPVLPADMEPMPPTATDISLLTATLGIQRPTVPMDILGTTLRQAPSAQGRPPDTATEDLMDLTATSRRTLPPLRCLPRRPSGAIARICLRCLPTAPRLLILRIISSLSRGCRAFLPPLRWNTVLLPKENLELRARSIASQRMPLVLLCICHRQFPLLPRMSLGRPLATSQPRHLRPSLISIL
mmetsp:Transcript_2878/g.6623  ORF Transcript_2878/g.6623 Transcript_2878/m.6623 type:complete len:402 (+) Transcript_2878:431-1636(+)